MRAKGTWPVDWVDTPQKNTTLRNSEHDSHTILNDFVSMCYWLADAPWDIMADPRHLK